MGGGELNPYSARSQLCLVLKKRTCLDCQGPRVPDSMFAHARRCAKQRWMYVRTAMAHSAYLSQSCLFSSSDGIALSALAGPSYAFAFSRGLTRVAVVPDVLLHLRQARLQLKIMLCLLCLIAWLARMTRTLRFDRVLIDFDEQPLASGGKHERRMT